MAESLGFSATSVVAAFFVEQSVGEAFAMLALIGCIIHYPHQVLARRACRRVGKRGDFIPRAAS